MSNFKYVFALFLAFLSLGAVSAFAEDEPDPYLREADVRYLLEQQGLDKTLVDNVISQLQAGPPKKETPPPTAPGETPAPPAPPAPLRIGGALFTHGVNGAFFWDNDWWEFDGKIKVNGQVVSVPKLFNIEYFDGGFFKMELGYKLVWVFLSSELPIDRLDGATFGGPLLGRGLAAGTHLVAGNPIFGEFGWIENQHGMGYAFVLSLGIDVFGGASATVSKADNKGAKIVATINSAVNFTFPKMVFKQKKLLPNQ